MGINLRLPNITGTTDREQITQLKSYLHQLVGELQWAMETMDTSAKSSSNTVVYTSKNTLLKNDVNPTVDATATFNAIKGLIIKSADIVEAYSQEMERRYNGIYVAQSDFGTYLEETEMVIEETSTNITQFFKSFKTIEGQVNLHADTLAYIKTGKLDVDDEGYDVEGIEIGQKKFDNDNEVKFDKFARFTSEKLEFFDPLKSTDAPIAWISGRKLYIPNAEVTASFQIGGLLDTVMDNGDVVTKWVGRG